MCAPAALAIAGIGMAGIQAGVAFQAKQADYNAKAAAWEQNVVNSEAGARDAYRQIIQQQLVEAGKDVQQRHVSFVTQAQKQSSAAVSAVEGGVSGISVDNILQDIAGKSAQNRTTADFNYRAVVADTTNKLSSETDQEMSHINSVPRPISPDPISIPLAMGGAAIGAFRGGGLSMGD